MRDTLSFNNTLTYDSDSLEKIGIRLLTGEACKLRARILSDLNEDGVELLRSFYGADIEFDRPNNQFVSGKPSVASALLPRESLIDYARFGFYARGALVVFEGPSFMNGMIAVFDESRLAQYVRNAPEMISSYRLYKQSRFEAALAVDLNESRSLLPAGFPLLGVSNLQRLGVRNPDLFVEDDAVRMRFVASPITNEIFGQMLDAQFSFKTPDSVSLPPEAVLTAAKFESFVNGCQAVASSKLHGLNGWFRLDCPEEIEKVSQFNLTLHSLVDESARGGVWRKPADISLGGAQFEIHKNPLAPRNTPQAVRSTSPSL